jgi:hypothetical protein
MEHILQPARPLNIPHKAAGTVLVVLLMMNIYLNKNFKK